MLDQKIFGEKLRNHRKKLGMTQEEVAERVGVSPQAISKWEAGDCLPDCFNLKAISDVYKISADVLLETESSGDLDAVSSKIEQLATEFLWAKSKERLDGASLHRELGNDLWQFWKGIYFAEMGDRRLQQECKTRGNLRICGPFGCKLWDDDGAICVIRATHIQNGTVASSNACEVLTALADADGQALLRALDCTTPISKEILLAKTNLEPHRLNELLLLFSEQKVIEFIGDPKISQNNGYKISGHCGVAAYMIIAALQLLEKKNYEVSEHFLQA